MNSLFISQIHYEYTLFFNSLEIEFRFWEFAIYVAKIPWVHYEFTCCFPMSSLWIHFLSHEWTIFSRIFYKSYFPSSKILYEFSIYFANSSWIHAFSLFISNSLSICYQFLEFTLKTISISRIRYLFRENTMNSLLDSRWHY